MDQNTNYLINTLASKLRYYKINTYRHQTNYVTYEFHTCTSVHFKPHDSTHLELVSGDSGDGLDLVGSEVIGV